MKFLSFALAMLGFLEFSSAKETTRILQSDIIGETSDGSPSPPGLPPELPDFKIKSTVVREIDVVEAPPMSGLPPVEGTITATVHLVEDPKLPDPVPPPPPTPVDPNDPLVQARRAALLAKYGVTKRVFVSASVYDHARTFLRWHPNGDVSKTMAAWSNVDFSYFMGFANFQVKGDGDELRKYSLMLQISNTDTAQMQARYQHLGKTYQAPVYPELPELAVNGPAFVVTEGNPSDMMAMQVIADLQTLYRVEGRRMADAYAARLQAEVERRAELLAHPPVPQDVTVNFWEREHPVGLPAETIKEGGGN